MTLRLGDYDDFGGYENHLDVGPADFGRGGDYFGDDDFGDFGGFDDFDF